MLKPCAICHLNNWTVAYPGPVRHGVFGRNVPGTVYRCPNCELEHLPPIIEDLNAYYQGSIYREDVGEAPDVLAYFQIHDAEQWRKYGLLEKFTLRGRVIVDVGCAGGSFLDGVRGFAATTIGVEPALSYHDSLQQRGHLVYASLADTLVEWAGRVDLVVCFSVIEHVEEPVEFLQAMRQLLTRDGCLLLSTPNQRDILLELGGEAYRSFFYRTVHLYYFNETSLRAAAQMAGFEFVEFRYIHRFNYANFINWLHNSKPTGNKGQTPLGPAFDRLWQGVLEEHGLADYLYAYMYPLARQT